MSDNQDLPILLVEDDPGHARLVAKNLRRANVSSKVVVLGDGQQALDYLFGEGEYAARAPARPLVVLLDLNLPVLDGYEVLERTRCIPVVVLTTTDDAAEVGRCYDLGCNAYITRSVEYQAFAETIHRLGLFLSVATIPEGE